MGPHAARAVAVAAAALTVAAVGAALWRRRQHRLPLPKPQIRRVAPPPPMRGFTAEDLAEYDGVRHPGRPILIGVRGIVFEAGPQFYGPGEPYSMYAGREISRPLAQDDLTAAQANSDWRTGLTEAEAARLQTWFERFSVKYSAVGWFVLPCGSAPERDLVLGLRR